MKLKFSNEQFDSLFTHLVPNPHLLENAAFAFASFDGQEVLVCQELWLLSESDLVVQLPYHIELHDDVRGKVIKRAHDSGLIIVELHSHLGERPAEFSWSDLAGFDSWVGHVRWRLKGAPYGAVVITKDSFDGFFWNDGIERLEAIEAGDQNRMNATEKSPTEWTLPEDWYVGH
ncbi:MAG: hypothetical protein ACK4UN_16530 [Limisphaerales bacterium]